MTPRITSSGALLRSILRAHLRAVVPGTLLRANHQVMEALVPVVVGQVIDGAIASSDGGRFLMWMAALVLVFVLLSASWFFGARLLDRAGLAAEHRLRMQLTGRVLDPQGGADRDRLPGELLSISTSDAERASWIIDLVATAAGAIAALLVATVVLLRISLPLGLLVLLGSVPVLVLIEFVGRMVHGHSAREQEQSALAAGLANDFVNGLRVLKGFGGVPAAATRYREASRASVRATLRAASINALYDGASLLITGAFLALVAYTGARLAADGQITIGDLIAALGLTQFLVGPMYRIAYVGAELARIRASAGRITAVLLTPPAVAEPAGSPPAQGPGGLAFHRVRSGTLNDITFDVRPGEVLGVVTADPADGDAMVELLARSADPSGGEILLDGVPLPAFPLADLRRRLLVAPHDAYLFAGSLIETVTGIPGADAGAVASVAEAASLGDVFAALPEGIHSAISEGGQSLSGGQRQRVALARALAADAPVLVLHEPTTAVDSVTEARIARGIRDLRAGRTTIIITSSPALLSALDRVVFIEAGTVSRIANHHDLVAASEDYRVAVLA